VRNVELELELRGRTLS